MLISENDTLEMHYNFWDDPEPHPEAGTIFLVRETSVGLGDEPVKANPDRKLLKVYDMMGREIDPDRRGGIILNFKPLKFVILQNLRIYDEHSF